MAGRRASEWDRVARLIEKAIRQLPPREQSVVVRYLVRGWLDLRFGHEQPPGGLRQAVRVGAPGSVELTSFPSALSMVPAGPEHQTLPVRLPGEQYARLKEWCEGQGFSMATVIRGLVERFLEAQAPPRKAAT